MDKNEVDKTILEAERFLAKNRPVDIERLKAKRRVLAGAYTAGRDSRVQRYRR